MIRYSIATAARVLVAMTLTLFAAAGHALSPAPRLVVPAGAETPIVLKRLAISSEISGIVALTTVEMEFFNPNRRQLEGELQFPLLDGQQIVGFALDINGKMRDAVVVDKTRGQQVFEDITRLRVDPGLLQATAGNNFKLRVYPIFAQQSRTVIIKYSESLVTRGAQGLYRLPLEYGAQAGRFSLAVDVRGSHSRPVASSALGSALAMSRTGSSYTAAIERADYTPRGVLEIAVPLTSAARVVTQQLEGSRYFFAELPVGSRKADRALPASVGLIWDSSASGASRNHVRELALLDAYFSRMRNGEVHLTRIRHAAEPAERYSVVDGDWQALRSALTATVYDGGTNLGAFTPDPAMAEYLLFSDGIDNLGAAKLAATTVPLYAITSSVQSNPALLKHVAHRSGGRYIDLLAESARVAADKLLSAHERIVGIASDGASQLMAVSPYPTTGTIAVTGILTEPSATVRVQLAIAGARTRSVTFNVLQGGDASRMAASFWARARIAELEADYTVHRAEILRLGRAFGVVTRATSLIVLETIQDYVRFDIAPPPELRAEFERLRSQTVQARAPDPQQKIAHAVALLNEKEAWWKREFPKGILPAPVEERHLRGPVGRLQQELAITGMAAESRPRADAQVPRTLAAPAPAAKPAPAQPARAEGKRKADSLIARDFAADRRFGNVAAAPPPAAYVTRLRSASDAELYRVYLDERSSYATLPAFYVDAAELLQAKGQRELALRVLSNLAEIDLENRQTLRTLGHRLMQAGEVKLALATFTKVLELSPEEPQSFRDLGLAYAAAGEHQRAIDTLYEVVVRPWHERFPAIELIALADLNAVVARHPGLDVSRIDPRLLRNMPVDVRVVLSWDADNTDLNLLVTDPNGQQMYPGGVSYQGGRTSQNFFGGYGPEEFSLRQAKPGAYKVAVAFGSQRQQVVGGGTSYAHVRVYLKFASGEQRERSYSVLLTRPGQVINVAEFDVPGKAAED